MRLRRQADHRIRTVYLGERGGRQGASGWQRWLRCVTVTPGVRLSASLEDLRVAELALVASEGCQALTGSSSLLAVALLGVLLAAILVLRTSLQWQVVVTLSSCRREGAHAATRCSEARLRSQGALDCFLLKLLRA